eukprot:m.314073 g.314073  ORF g.314073 m.314073 type:complete len:53 (+) comp475127_c0_seq1:119-277(+)
MTLGELQMLNDLVTLDWPNPDATFLFEIVQKGKPRERCPLSLWTRHHAKKSC